MVQSESYSGNSFDEVEFSSLIFSYSLQLLGTRGKIVGFKRGEHTKAPKLNTALGEYLCGTRNLGLGILLELLITGMSKSAPRIISKMIEKV